MGNTQSGRAITLLRNRRGDVDDEQRPGSQGDRGTHDLHNAIDVEATEHERTHEADEGPDTHDDGNRHMTSRPRPHHGESGRDEYDGGSSVCQQFDEDVLPE